MNQHFVVYYPGTENTNPFLYFGHNPREAAKRASEGYDVRLADYLQQPWDEMKVPKKLIDYGNNFFLLSF